MQNFHRMQGKIRNLYWETGTVLLLKRMVYSISLFQIEIR